MNRLNKRIRDAAGQAFEMVVDIVLMRTPSLPQIMSSSIDCCVAAASVLSTHDNVHQQSVLA